MTTNNRKKALQNLYKQAEKQTLLKSIAQEASNISNTAEAEAYAKNALKQMLEATEIDFPIDSD